MSDRLASAARSWLFVPGDRPERFERAWTSGADRVIVDLEDGSAAGAPHLNARGGAMMIRC